jgi:hypothetical protein
MYWPMMNAGAWLMPSIRLIEKRTAAAVTGVPS